MMNEVWVHNVKDDQCDSYIEKLKKWKQVAIWCVKERSEWEGVWKEDGGRSVLMEFGKKNIYFWTGWHMHWQWVPFNILHNSQ